MHGFEKHEFKLVMIAQIVVLSVTILFSLAAVFADGTPFVKNGLPIFTRTLFGVVLIAAVFLAIRKETFLPFLGATVFPPSAVHEVYSPPNASVSVNVNVNAPDTAKVVYWAAQPSKSVFANPWVAYDGYKNFGVSKISKGVSILRVNCPANYKVNNTQLSKHVHYRVVYEDGVVGPVETVFVNC